MWFAAPAATQYLANRRPPKSAALWTHPAMLRAGSNDLFTTAPLAASNTVLSVAEHKAATDQLNRGGGGEAAPPALVAVNHNLTQVTTSSMAQGLILSSPRFALCFEDVRCEIDTKHKRADAGGAAVGVAQTPVSGSVRQVLKGISGVVHPGVCLPLSLRLLLVSLV